MGSNMDFYSDFHNCQLDLMTNIKRVEDELFGLEKTYAVQNELCHSLERELNSIERDFAYENVLFLKASTCKDDLTRKISLMEDSIKEERSRLASTRDATAEKKYRVLKECQNVEDKAHDMRNHFAQKDSSRKIFELEEILSTEENNFAEIEVNVHNASKEISKLKREIANASADSNAVIVEIASTVLKLKRMKGMKAKSSYKESTLINNNQSNQYYNNTNTRSFPSNLSRKIENRAESLVDRLKAKYSGTQQRTDGSRFSPESVGRKPLLPMKQLPLRSPLLQGQKAVFQLKGPQTPIPQTPIQKPLLPPKPLQPAVKQVHQTVVTPEQFQTPVKEIPQSIIPREQLQKPGNKMQQTMLPPKQLQTPVTQMRIPLSLPKPLLREQNQNKKEVDSNQNPNPKDSLNSREMTNFFQFPGSSNPQSSISNNTIDIFASNPGETSNSFGGGLSFLTNGISENDDIDSMFGSSNSNFLF